MTPSIAVLTTLAIHLGPVSFGTVSLGTDAVGGSSLGANQGSAGAALEDPVPPPSVPKGTVEVEAAPATKGATEVEGQGKFAAAELEAIEGEDATELEISAGGVLATGNAFSAAVTGLGRFRLRRGIHQMAAQAAGNFARADVSITDAMGRSGTERETTVANVQGMARYDVFFAERWSAFVMATARRDRFQGLDLRFNLDPGVAFHALTDAKHRLWFEAGYDFQYDVRRDEALYDDTGTQVTEKTQVNHAVRLFAGYNNSLSQRVTFDTGFEYLQSVLVGSRFRLNWVNALTTQLANRVGLSVTFTLRYENEPLPDVVPLDTITAVLLTVRFI